MSLGIVEELLVLLVLLVPLVAVPESAGIVVPEVVVGAEPVAPAVLCWLPYAALLLVLAEPLYVVAFCAAPAVEAVPPMVADDDVSGEVPLAVPDDVPPDIVLPELPVSVELLLEPAGAWPL